MKNKMVSVGTYLDVIDNSGAMVVQCLKILGGVPKRKGYVGDVVILSAVKVNPLKKIKKGDVLRGVIVSTKKSKLRHNGVLVTFDTNSVVIINVKNLPVGTRITGPVMLELRSKQFLKVLSLAKIAI